MPLALAMVIYFSVWYSFSKIWMLY